MDVLKTISIEEDPKKKLNFIQPGQVDSHCMQIIDSFSRRQKYLRATFTLLAFSMRTFAK